MSVRLIFVNSKWFRTCLSTWRHTKFHDVYIFFLPDFPFSGPGMFPVSSSYPIFAGSTDTTRFL